MSAIHQIKTLCKVLLDSKKNQVIKETYEHSVLIIQREEDRLEKINQHFENIEVERITAFLTKYGYVKEDNSGEYGREISFCQDNACGIDITVSDIALIDDSGDFLHLPINIYALIGALILYRQPIPLNFSL